MINFSIKLSEEYPPVCRGLTNIRDPCEVFQVLRVLQSNRGKWSREEDEELEELVERLGQNWEEISGVLRRPAIREVNL